MKLVTRLTLLLSALTTLLVFSVGWFAVNLSTNSQYSKLDGTINAVVASGEGHPNSALSDALNVVQAQSYDLTLDVIAPGGGVTVVSSGTVTPPRSPTLRNALASRGGVHTLKDLPGFHVRSIDAGGGAYLMVIGSTGQIDEASRRLALDLALVGITATVIMMVLVRIFTRRDLQTMERLIVYASDVANGRDEGPIPPSLGSSDVRQLQAALATMVEALHERISIETRSAELMQEFVGDASHELRTPLTVIKGYNELLANPAATPAQISRAVERMRREIERMELLIADLLLAAELREVPQQFTELVDVSMVLAERTDEFSNDYPLRLVTSSISPGLFVRGRSDYVDRLLANAFGNIVRHTDDDVAVRVSLHRERDQVVLRIEDAGPGLPVYGLRPKRFGRFDQSRSRETGGSGLGMSIMADIAESFGGSLTTSRSDLGGLALTVVLPQSTPVATREAPRVS